MSVYEEAIRNATGRSNAPLDLWMCTNPSIYHADRFHTYRNCPNKMDPYVADIAKQSIQDYAQRNSAMGGIRVSQGIQYGRGKTSSTTTCSAFANHRAHLYNSWNKEGFRSLDQVLLICEMDNPYNSRSARVAYAAAIKAKIDRENRKRGYEGQIEEPYLGGGFKGQEDILKVMTNLIVR